MKQLVVVLAIAACGGTPAPKPAPPEPAPEAPAPHAEPNDPTGALAQAALAEQYDAGKKLYVDKKCATCHGDHGEGNPKNPPVIGEHAYPAEALPTAKLRKGISFTTAKDVLDFVRAKMPLKAPGTLTDDEAAAVTSWMLSETKVAIDRPLRASNAASIKLR